MATTHSKGLQGAAWVNIVLGLLILATPFFTGDTSTAPLWNALVTGALIVVLSGFNAYAGAQKDTGRAYGPAMTNILIGLYVVAMGFFMTVSTAYVTSMVIYGLIVVALAAYNTWAASDARRVTA